MRALPEDFRTHAEEVRSRYPKERSALIMLLHDAQDIVGGYLTAAAIRDVAEVMNLSPADVAGVATFYTMFKRESPGKYLLSLCTNVGCGIFGADETAAKLRELLGEPNQTPADGIVSWEPVECLAYCNWAPIAQINYEDVPYLTPERAEQLVSQLKGGAPIEQVLSAMRETRAKTPQEAAGA